MSTHRPRPFRGGTLAGDQEHQTPAATVPRAGGGCGARVELALRCSWSPPAASTSASSSIVLVVLACLLLTGTAQAALPYDSLWPYTLSHARMQRYLSDPPAGTRAIYCTRADPPDVLFVADSGLAFYGWDRTCYGREQASAVIDSMRLCWTEPPTVELVSFRTSTPTPTPIPIPPPQSHQTPTTEKPSSDTNTFLLVIALIVSCGAVIIAIASIATRPSATAQQRREPADADLDQRINELTELYRRQP